MVPSRVAGGRAQSPSSSGIFFQGDGQSLVAGNSQLSSNFGNSSSSLHGNTRANLGLVSGDVSNTYLNSVGSSGPSVGESSLVTDANSGLSASPHLQRSASINTESYMRLPASPLSFSSNNISISGSSVMDGSSVVQQTSNQDSGSQQAHQSQQHQGASSATSLPRMGQVQFPGGARVSNSFIQGPTNISQLHKKPRLELKHEDIVQQQVLQQLLQRQDPMHLQNSSPQLQALIHQQRLRQQEQQLLQTMPPIQRMQLLQQQQQQQQLQLRQQMLMQGMPPAVKRPFDGGVCSRRLMQYLYHQRQRPADNTIAYWRKFVAEYYSPRAKQRWCLSLYENVGNHSLGVFPQAAMDAWQCDICGSKSGRGFEATFEVLPRLNEIKFGSGVIEELLFLDWPREFRFPSGIMMLEYAKAVQETVYEQLRVVREGQLRIFFTPELKILSWEFCALRHEELLPRRLVAPQVNQLLQVAQKCQNTLSQSGADGVSQQDLQENSLRVVTAGRQLARSLELQSLNDLGFSKRYVRCLQIADVFNSMKDLMDFCGDKKAGPIEGLKSFPRCTTASNVQMQKLQELNQSGGHQGLAMHPGVNSQMSNNQNASGRGALNGVQQVALAMTNYQNMLTRQNSTQQQEGSSSLNTSSQAVPYGSSGTFPGILHNSPTNGFSGSQVPQQQQSHGNVLIQQQSQSLPSQHNQTLHQKMVQQYLQDMSRKNNGGGAVVQQPPPKQNPSGGTGTSVSEPGIRNSGSETTAEVARFKEASSSMSESTAAMGFDQKETDFIHGLHSSDEMASDIANELIENGILSCDLDDFDWR